MISRTGMGFDVHAFAAGDGLVARRHARSPTSAASRAIATPTSCSTRVTDALLGAIGDGDIGDHFPPSDPQWRGAASSLFVEHARDLIEARADGSTMSTSPSSAKRRRIGPHRAAMRAALAALLRLPPARISIKATTTERLGFTGRGEGIAAQAVATVRLPEEITEITS